MKIAYKNLKKVLYKKLSFLATIISIVAIWALFYFFDDSQLTIWNLGYNFYITQFTLEIIISLLFWIFVWATIYKLTYFSSNNTKNNFIWWLGWFFWVLVTGCPACSITIASYIWLASIISVFPYHGLELKVLSFVLLLYVVYDTLYNLEICKVKIKK